MGFDPLTMAAAGISAGSTLLSAYGEYSSANEQASALDAQRYFDIMNAQNKAKALNYAATTAMASSQREAMARVEDKNLALSRAQAVNAASGGGTTDASYVNTVAGIEEQGEYNKAVALFAGETEMRQLNYEAQNAMIEGQNVANARSDQAGQLRRQGRMKAAGTLLSGAASTGNYLRRKAPAGLGLASDADLEIADAKAKSARDLLDWQTRMSLRRYYRDD
ncbi:hypothetical protein [Methylocystis echinoides]|uniref:hypothetical protein n=1 Tax=Methylocystis echinoides TaxID=29468 RepID=UPI003420FADA